MMKRSWALALLPLLAGACGDGQGASDSCNGEITINLEAPGGVSSANTIELAFWNDRGLVHVETLTPPPPLPTVLIRLGEAYQPGRHLVRAVAASGKPVSASAKSPVDVLSRLREWKTLEGDCPTLALSLERPKTLDICFDGCEEGVRCGVRRWDEMEQCERRCQAAAEQFGDLQKKWEQEYQNAGQMVSRMVGCSYAACEEVANCGEAVLMSAEPKAPW